FLRLSWYESDDGSGEAMGSVGSTETLATDDPDFRSLTTGPVQAPAEARSARVRLMLRPASAAPVTVHFDALSFFRAGPPAAAAALPSGDTTPVEPSASPPHTPAATALAAFAAASAPRDLANVRAAAGQGPPSPDGGGRSYGWLALLAAVAPAAALVFAAGYETGRRLAGKDKGHL
ncbi:MAG: hypothetical protein HYY03_00990, partial [Chloroflexi bacterium]|nr:hypothetical protein [Chloroflexota bacterium]